MTVHPPGRTALYRLFNADGQLLYVGISSDPPTRYVNHAYEKLWWHEVATTTEEWIETRAEALREETRAIKTELPCYNRLGHPDYPPKPPQDGTSVAVKDFKNKSGEYIAHARYGGKIFYLYNRHKRVAALTPASLAELADAVGGAGAAERILKAHLESAAN